MARWRVNKRDLFLILCTFAFAGSSSAWLSRQITTWFTFSTYSTGWWCLKIFSILIGYQLFILFFGFCFGQFSFFWNYEKRILAHAGLIRFPERPYRIAIFASGTGTNARNIIEYFHSKKYKGRQVSIDLIVTNNEKAGVLHIAEKHNIPFLIIRKDRFLAGDAYLPEFSEIDLIVMAGFLWKVPKPLIDAFEKRIINIHPALLPKYGGKGMYGVHVHEAVLRGDEKETGITIHYADENYDEGDIILQVRCLVEPTDTTATIAKKVQALEHQYFPQAIESVIKVKSALNQTERQSGKN